MYPKIMLPRAMRAPAAMMSLPAMEFTDFLIIALFYHKSGGKIFITSANKSINLAYQF